jgi:hypothetical protein
MKRVLFFVLLFVTLDRVIGWTGGELYRHTYTGERGGLLNYALTKDADVLVLGSSRAQYHVMPSVLERQLSLTAFNAGLKGHDFLYSVMLFDLWQRAHPAPRVVLLQVDIESLLDRDSELESAQIFAPYLDDSAIVRDVLYAAGPFKRIEYWSHAYRYNGKAFSIARNLFTHPDPGADGFVPAIGTIDGTDVKLVNALDQDATALDYARRPFSARKLRYLQQLADYGVRHRTRIVLFHSPLYEQDETAHRLWADRMRTLAATMPKVEFLDLCAVTRPDLFAHNPALYHDVNHLNERGAAIFSTLLADELKSRLSTDVINARLNGHAATAQRLN